MGGNYNEEMLEKFAMQIISEKGLELGEFDLIEERDKIVDELNELLEDATIRALPEEKADALEKAIDEKGDDLTEDEANAILEGTESEINSAIEAVLNDYKEKYLKGEN